jgi:hypothetical protein
MTLRLVVLAGQDDRVAIETCDECGFNGTDWSDEAVLAAIADLPGRWVQATAGLSNEDATRRSIPGMWSIAEYSDHVRETIFGMRFVIDLAIDSPGIDLGEHSEARFDDAPRPLDLARSIRGFQKEVRLLLECLSRLSDEERAVTAVMAGDRVGVAWITRHAIHDVTHHLGDVRRLRIALTKGPSSPLTMCL